MTSDAVCYVAQIFNRSVAVGIVAGRANLIVRVLLLVLLIENIEEEKEDEDDL